MWRKSRPPSTRPDSWIDVDATGDGVNGQDREQFREFMVSRWPELVRLAYGLTGDRWLAEDLAQTALAGACTVWWRVSRADDPDAYVRRILINASNRRFRRRRPAEEVRRRRPAEEVRRLPEAPLADPAALADQRSDLMTALRGLPPRQRAVIVLRYWGDLSDAQVAALLGCSEGTVRSQAWRALAKLRVSTALVDGDSR
jgi:RNA polymerase sigma-70 factor (sigma-E family)